MSASYFYAFGPGRNRTGLKLDWSELDKTRTDRDRTEDGAVVWLTN